MRFFTIDVRNKQEPLFHIMDVDPTKQLNNNG